MKTGELKRLLKAGGCYFLKEGGEHETWYSPKTGKYFTMSHHGSQEVKPGTLKSILRDAGLE